MNARRQARVPPDVPEDRTECEPGKDVPSSAAAAGAGPRALFKTASVPKPAKRARRKPFVL